MINILLGIGGTGAKVIESALMLLMAGAGPAKTYVGLIDQDGANGNVSRTHRTLNDYLRFRQTWAEEAHPAHTLKWGTAHRGAIGDVDIEPLFEDAEDNNRALWCPTKRSGTLRSLVGENMSAEQRALFDLLFMRGEEEQELSHDKGYRGRAHVGATAMMAALIDDDNRLMKRLRSLMEDPAHGPVNIFIVGSAFGGTGAAGFPTLARALHRLRRSPDFANPNQVAIGGLLMLPYFSFKDPDEAGEAVVTSDEIMPKARLALEFYDTLFQREKTFDQFFTLGWPELLPLGYHEAGGPEQANPAMPPEWLAATSIMEFFATAERPDPDDASPVRVRTSARMSPAIRWRNLASGKGLMGARLISLLRFCAYWRYMADPILDEKKFILRNWAQKQASRTQRDDAVDALKAVNTLADDVLNWAAAIEYTAGPAFWEAGPWDLRPLRDPAHKATPTRPVRLLETVGSDIASQAIDRLIRNDDGETRADTASVMYETLLRCDPPPGEHQGWGRTLASVYLSAQQTTGEASHGR